MNLFLNTPNSNEKKAIQNSNDSTTLNPSSPYANYSSYPQTQELREESILETTSKTYEKIFKNIENQIDKLIKETNTEINSKESLLKDILSSKCWKIAVLIRNLTKPLHKFLACISSPIILIKNLNTLVKLDPLYLTLKQVIFGWALSTLFIKFQITEVNIFLKNLINSHTSQLKGETEYEKWILNVENPSKQNPEALKNNIKNFQQKPLISIIMTTANPSPIMLIEAIFSVKKQIYSFWELCIVTDGSTDPRIIHILKFYKKNDNRINLIHRKDIENISSANNYALELIKGDYVTFLDHNDKITTDALYWVVDAINQNPGVCLLYSDEDKIDTIGQRHTPYFKCDFNYELLLAQNMINHMAVYHTQIVREIGNFKIELEGAHDYDFLLRAIEKIDFNQIIHIPRILYHQRTIDGNTTLSKNKKHYSAEVARQAVQSHLDRIGKPGIVVAASEKQIFNRVIFDKPDPAPLVSIIILTKDKANLLHQCVESVISLTTYSNYEIIIVDNGSEEIYTLDLLKHFANYGIKILKNDAPFNFSALNNFAIKECKGEIICLMNNDIKVITKDWLEEMLSFATIPEIGCVGARLWYSNQTLQHGGVVLGICSGSGHAHKYLPRGEIGYFGRAILHQNFSAITGACLMVRRNVFDQVGGMDESLAVSFNDIDFCLRVKNTGYRNVWTPYAEMIHYESATRGHDIIPEKQARFFKEWQFMKDRWGKQLIIDPAYSINLTRDKEDWSIRTTL